MLLIAQNLFAQIKKPGKIYGAAYIGIEAKNAHGAGGVLLGYAFKNLYGVGINAETMGMDGNLVTKTLITYMGEFRMVLPKYKSIKPSIALQYGLATNFSDGMGISDEFSVHMTNVKATDAMGIHAMISFLNKRSSLELAISYGFRSIKLKTTNSIETSVLNITNERASAHVIAIGVSF